MQSRSAVSLADLREKCPDPRRDPRAFNEIHRCQYRARNGEDQRCDSHRITLGCFFIVSGAGFLRDFLEV